MKSAPKKAAKSAQPAVKKKKYDQEACMFEPCVCTTSTRSKGVGTKTTKITVKCNCGFPNNLFLRGEGVNGLNWNKGVAMKNIKADEWVWETSQQFNKAQFKILLNDKQYEAGENHALECGASVRITPKF